MLHPVTFRTLAVAACGWLLACDALALSLGRARGTPLIGRPLEIAIPVTLDSPADREQGPCASGELLYGDARVSRPPTMRWQPGPAAEGTLYITSAVPVDEPSVTLSLRIGCGQTSMRRYTLLSELPTEVEPSALAPRAPLPPMAARPAAPAVAQAPAAAEAGPPPTAASPRQTSPRRSAGTAPATTAAAQATPSTQAAAPARPASRARRPEPAPEPRSRLKVEPFVPGVERDPVLRLTAELATQLAADPSQRQAAAALWAALQKSPDEAIQDSIRLQAVQRDVEALRNITRQNAAAVTQMRQQVEQARGERQTASWLVLGLAALLAAVLAGLAWRWHRSRQVDRVGRWFEAHGDAQASMPAPVAPVSQPSVPPVTEPPPAKVKPAKAGKAAKPGKPAAAPEPAAEPATGAASRAGPVSVWAPAEEFQASRGGTVRMVGVEELIDVHDKADFFLSIGAVDQAMAVLEAHVHDQVETSALAWMDLLELYHAHDRRAEYERLRAEFLQRFTVQVPDFEHFDQPTASLENYGRALSRIVALWPSPKVLEVIEESIFRKPGLPGAEPFSLEAYRELVLLYHVAKDVAPEQPQEARPTTFSDTSLQPLNVMERPESADVDRERLMIPPASVRLGVDIELDDVFAEPGNSPAPAQAAAPASGELPPLDFDVSEFDDIDDGKPQQKRG